MNTYTFSYNGSLSFHLGNYVATAYCTIDLHHGPIFDLFGMDRSGSDGIPSVIVLRIFMLAAAAVVCSIPMSRSGAPSLSFCSPA
jgi:hypothetical protein